MDSKKSLHSGLNNLLRTVLHRLISIKSLLHAATTYDCSSTVVHTEGLFDYIAMKLAEFVIEESDKYHHPPGQQRNYYATDNNVRSEKVPVSNFDNNILSCSISEGKNKPLKLTDLELVSNGSLSLLRIVIVPLDGDFSAENHEDWSQTDSDTKNDVDDLEDVGIIVNRGDSDDSEEDEATPNFGFLRHLSTGIYASLNDATIERNFYADAKAQLYKREKLYNKDDPEEDINMVRKRSLHEQLGELPISHGSLEGEPNSGANGNRHNFYSTFHKTPNRKKFSEEEWEEFTLASSPVFTDWVIKSADRIKAAPEDSSNDLDESGSDSIDEDLLWCALYFLWTTNRGSWELVIGMMRIKCLVTPLKKKTVKLPSYRGDNINGDSFDKKSRIPDPNRMIQADTQPVSTLSILRAFATGCYAAMQREPMGFMAAVGLIIDYPIMTTTQIWASHECLLLPYEQPLTREDFTSGLYYDCSAHMVWVGEWTRHLKFTLRSWT
ncbi:3-deoxy-7-phosphoheptulonate synthase [Artemisia annua]|uniref:Phospho-2-dehydro-3-deoxyheptonate aldolase n=1 Tax=Artemisia annua TaxID=35608 RepID=A0A2U1P6B4_ARTAN|nr:3-deoxy-7-phosphoheptulonate synthase [Artemisia annua]